VRGGLWNVLINLKDITDAGYVAEKKEACARLLGEAKALADEAGSYVDGRLLSMIEKKK
jgi:formiminotetrahydrofolate cyclodeaminase